MFETITEQFQKLGQPAGEMITQGAEALKKISEKNTALFNELVDDTVNFAREASNQSQVSDLIELQKNYATAVQAKLGAAARDSWTDLVGSQEKASEFVKSATEQFKAGFDSVMASVKTR